MPKKAIAANKWLSKGPVERKNERAIKKKKKNQTKHIPPLCLKPIDQLYQKWL